MVHITEPSISAPDASPRLLRPSNNDQYPHRPRAEAAMLIAMPRVRIN
jgi:hypothetical protein